MVFGAAHLEEGRTVDFKLRDLVKKSDNDEAVEWQLQRLMEGNKWRNVQQIVMERMGGDPADNRVEALKTMALLAEERMPESGKAADFWRQVHQADKFDIDARHALLEVYEAAGKWKEFAAILKLEVDDIPEHDVVARLDGLRRLVAVTSAHLRQDAQVIAMYGDILALDPDDAEATEALCARYEKMRRWPDLVELLRRQADAADGEARLDILSGLDPFIWRNAQSSRGHHRVRRCLGRRPRA